tara:strand:- start:1840 stop:2163 length:324 start_codon:yes stop_codon:yes gene_type:complete
MQLLINEYRISRLDDMNIVLEQYVKLNPRNPYGRNGKTKNAKPTTNKFKWVRLGYHNTLTDALNKLVNHNLLSGEGETTAQEILSGLAELKNEIIEKVNELDLAKTA